MPKRGKPRSVEIDLKRQLPKQGWELSHGLFEVFWKNGRAEKVRIEGAVFYWRERGPQKGARRGR